MAGIRHSGLDRVKESKDSRAVSAKPEIKLEKKSDSVYVDSAICSISSEPMIDPWVTEVGQSYDGQAIKKWIEKNKLDPRDPNTQQPLKTKQLIPNIALKNVIQEYSVRIDFLESQLFNVTQLRDEAVKELKELQSQKIAQGKEYSLQVAILQAQLQDTTKQKDIAASELKDLKLKKEDDIKKCLDMLSKIEKKNEEDHKELKLQLLEICKQKEGESKKYLEQVSALKQQLENVAKQNDEIMFELESSKLQINAVMDESKSLKIINEVDGKIELQKLREISVQLDIAKKLLVPERIEAATKSESHDKTIKKVNPILKTTQQKEKLKQINQRIKKLKEQFSDGKVSSSKLAQFSKFAKSPVSRESKKESSCLPNKPLMI